MQRPRDRERSTRRLVGDALSRRDRAPFAPFYDLIFYSHLRSRSLVYGTERYDSPPCSLARPPARSLARSLISVDRFFVEDAAAYKIASAGSRREQGEPPIQKQPRERWPAYDTNCGRLASCFTTAREIKLRRGVCDAPLAHRRVFPQDERKLVSFPPRAAD
jgi:hypothetical protein